MAILTPRERQVLDILATGKTSKEAGRDLGISGRTVEFHSQRIMAKYGARNRVELLRAAAAEHRPTLPPDVRYLLDQYRNDMMFPAIDDAQRKRRIEAIDRVLNGEGR